MPDPDHLDLAIFDENERMGAFLVQFLAIFVHSGLPLWIMEAVDRD